MSRKFIVALLLSVSLSSLGVVAVTAQNGSGTQDVLKFRGNPARTGEMTGPDPNQNITALWSFAAEDEIYSSPVVVNRVVYIGSDDHSLYAIDATSGQSPWSFDTAGAIYSSPAVVDGVVYFTNNDQSATNDDRVFAFDGLTWQELYSFDSGDYHDSSPAAVNGAVYIGSLNWHVYSISNPTSELQAATETAQDEAAIEQSWQTYAWTDLQSALTSFLSILPGMFLATGSDGFDSPNIPTGYRHMAIYPTAIAGGIAGGWIALTIFCSTDEANAAMATMSGGLSRSGWQPADPDGLDHDHACLTLQSTDSSQAICYMTRDDALIVRDSTIAVPNPDAALLNAADVANVMSDAYDPVERPADLGTEFGDTS